jgi:hypothetical protein
MVANIPTQSLVDYLEPGARIFLVLLPQTLRASDARLVGAGPLADDSCDACRP